MRKALSACLASLTCLLLSTFVIAAEITTDTTWSGVVTVREDTRVIRGVTLTIEAGAKVYFQPAESTKTEPQFWNPDTELAVEGRLLVRGTSERPVLFAPETGIWGGIVLVGPNSEISHATVTGADEALLVAAPLKAVAVRIENSGTGLILALDSRLEAQDVTIAGCSKGLVDLTGGSDPATRCQPQEGDDRKVAADTTAFGCMPKGVAVTGSKDADHLVRSWEGRYARPPLTLNPAGEGIREFVGEYTVEGEETWKGTIVISSRVTVPPGSMLRIAPGARILFRKRDTNGDGLGEGELLILGSVRCQGTKDAPVLIGSAEENPEPGDWDKVSIISSEDAENIFEYAIFQYGTMALHAHFSNFTAKNCEFLYNMRALQFQESEDAVVENSRFYGNKQAMRFRDSKVRVKDCELRGNLYAFHIFRCEVSVSGTLVEDTILGGLLAKESRVTLTGNRFFRSREAMKQKGEGSVLAMKENRLLQSVETAVSLSEVKASMDANDLADAGLDLIGLDGGEAVMRMNDFGKSGRHAIHLNSATGADASCNKWYGEPAERIYDKGDDTALGIVILDSKCN